MRSNPLLVQFGVIQAALNGHRQAPLKRESLQRLEHKLERRLSRVQRWPAIGGNILEPMRQLLALVPGDGDAQEAGLNILRELNQRALGALTLHLSNTPVAALVIGCRRRLAYAHAARQSFQSRFPWPCLVVVGNPNLLDWQWRFQPEEGLLELPCGDAYEHLAHKLMTLMLVWGQLRQPPALLKLDDDARPQTHSHQLLTVLQLLNDQQLLAAGLACSPEPAGQLDRAWHLGKCSSRRANERSYSSLAPKRWLSGGAGYLVHPKGVQALARHSLIHWGFVDSMLYEDVCISMLLESEADEHSKNTLIHWLDDPSQLAVTNERLQEHGYS